MGEKERGKPDLPLVEPLVSSTPTAGPSPASIQAAPASPATPIPKNAGFVARGKKATKLNGIPPTAAPGVADTSRGWGVGWRQIVWEKWRWGILIALAVIVSRITSST